MGERQIVHIAKARPIPIEIGQSHEPNLSAICRAPLLNVDQDEKSPIKTIWSKLILLNEE